MPAKPNNKPNKRIAIAIELDYPYPRHHGCYQGILEYAEEKDWDCVVDPHLVGATGRSDITDYDGIVGRISESIAQSAEDHGIPAVNHWLNSPVTDRVPNVFSDYLASAAMSAEHLTARGFRRLGYMGIARDMEHSLEVRGLEAVAEAHGLPRPEVYDVPRTFEANPKMFAKTRHDLPQWVSALRPPFGVVTINGVIGRYLVQICREMGLRVPHDVGVVVQSGDNMVCQHVKPTLSSAHHDYARVGYEAAALLDQLMSGDHTRAHSTVLIPPHRLFVRESSDAFVSPDPLTSEALRYIADHSQQPLKVDDVADALNISRRTLERRFETYVGASVYTEITRMRTETIKRLLMDTDRPLAAVAMDCGFSGVSHFTEYFRKSAGVTPSAFRKAGGPS